MKTLKLFSFILVLGLLGSCYPEKDRSIEDFDIVGTNYDDTKDFADYTTYYLHDSLIIIYDTNEDKPDYPSDAAAAVIDGIRNNLNGYGWKEMTPADTVGKKPDVYINPYLWTSKVSGAVYYPPYYGGYPWYPGYYPGYPSWGGASYYSYTTGTILIDMLDIKHPNHDEDTFDILWSAGINGILSSSESNNDNRIKFSVDQAFSQSKYLKKN